ncbi:hypothetical protein Tco_0557078 [Tanacetum coccineum]
MRTRSQARRRRQPQVRQTSVESSNLEKPDNPPLVRWMIIHYYGVTARCTHRGLSWELDSYSGKSPRITLRSSMFYEAWDRFNDLLRGCPHHGFSELHQLDTFYNALNSNDQDSLNSAAGASTSGSGTLSWTCSSQSCHRGDKGHDCLHDNNGSTEDVQPPVVQIQSRNQNPEPNIAPVVPPVPKASIPFPSRRNDERRRKI